MRVIALMVLLAGCGGGSEAADAGAMAADARPATDACACADSGVLDPDRDGGPGPLDAGSASDPDGPGPHATSTRETSITRDGRTIPVVAHIPEGAGAAPLVLLLPGFQLESRRYAPLADRIASHGFAVVRADPPASLTSADHVAMAADARAVIDWALAELDVDAARIAVAGHSLGGKVATMVAADDARVGALLGIDPVNGGNPFTGYSETQPDIVPERVATLRIPVGFLGETTSASGGFMPCAPADQNFTTFYGAATAAPWAAQWDFTGADHMDFVDDVSGCGFVCSACPDGPADDALVRAGTHAIAVAFFRRHLRGELAMEPWLTGPDLPPGVVATSR